ncbi:sensor histidine kinase [Archangium lansingense]|uniref:sensor histidine kinase n=1 Tax=Archangium lansingense TaxID=2995310 RepID=UPI003B825541
MRASPSKSPQVLDPEQVLQGLHPLMLSGSLLISAAVGLQYLGQWRVMAWVFGANALRIFLNVLLSKVFARRLAPSVVEWARLAVNVSILAAIGVLAGWSLLLWSYVPFSMFWLYGMNGSGRGRALVYIGVMDGAALLSGCDPFEPLAFSLLAVLSFLMTEKRAELLQRSLEHIIEQREQLARAQGELRLLHERAFEQEKFSSLGLMAAGVAHEINNPMAFVTSNVNSLYKDLKQQQPLAEPLKEYVDEVLPATLDGIKRVNAIVSDLRRFARGDPEVYSEYDPNEEAKAALRIVQGQLHHVRAELELGEVGKVVGRPQQLVQVLVNMLANAGQATAPGGAVRLSTREEEDGIRVEVRDTGMGMTPETLRNLFQPFFTTKPPGMGTGLGLAVAHSIVTGQGGHIEVESTPGKGACFTLHLPRVAHRPSRSTGDRVSAAAA